MLQVDGGSTATYVYDALDHRVQTIENGTNTVYAYNINGQRVASFDGSGNPVSNQVYADSTPVAFYQGGAIHYQHQDWLGTERTRTNASGGVEGTYQSEPFGDGFSSTGTDNDQNHFAMLDRDTDDTHHATFRQYSSTQGRWMSPDPYDGSYDSNNPQSFNRYAYVLNNPLAMVDPRGLECVWDNGSFDAADDPITGGQKQCDGAGGTWIDHDYFTANNLPDWSSQPNSDLADMTVISATVTAPDSSVTFSLNSAGGTGSSISVQSPAPNNNLPTPTRFKLTIPGTNYCGPGGSGTPTDRVDSACAAHDKCYGKAGVSFLNNIGWPKTPQQSAAIQACDAALAGAINAITWATSNEQGEATLVTTYFNLQSGYNLHPFW